MEGKRVTPEQIKTEGGKNRTDRIRRGVEGVGQAQDTAERTATEKSRPGKGNHGIPAAVKSPMQCREKKDDNWN